MENISLAICDDAEYWCRYLRQVISKSDEVQVIGEAHSAAECINMVQKIKPDILMLDIQMETEQAGIDAVPRLLETCPDMKIIILTSYDEENYIFSAFANGVDDYMMKTHPKDDIINVIRSVYHNTSSLRPEIAKKLTKKTKEIESQQHSLLYIFNNLTQLSTSEFEVLQALYFGEDYKTIAQERFVEESTVRRMASRILQKFGEKNMKKLVANLREIRAFDLLQR